MLFGRKRPRVTIQATKPAAVATGARLYELLPESYQGPWSLPVGTVLEVVSEPKET